MFDRLHLGFEGLRFSLWLSPFASFSPCDPSAFSGVPRCTFFELSTCYVPSRSGPSFPQGRSGACNIFGLREPVTFSCSSCSLFAAR